MLNALKQYMSHYVHRNDDDFCPITDEEWAEVERLTMMGRSKGLRQRFQVLTPDQQKTVDIRSAYREATPRLTRRSELIHNGFSLVPVVQQERDFFHGGWRKRRKSE